MKGCAKLCPISSAGESFICPTCPGTNGGGGMWQLVLSLNLAGLTTFLWLGGHIQTQRIWQVTKWRSRLSWCYKPNSFVQYTQPKWFPYRFNWVKCGIRWPPGTQWRELRVYTVPHQPSAANVQPGHFRRWADLGKRWACLPWLLLLKHITRRGGERGRGSSRDGQMGRGRSRRGQRGVYGFMVYNWR